MNSFSTSPEYRAFRDAKVRCTDHLFPGFRNYGGRGIQFRLNSVQDIIDDIGYRPTVNYQFGRIDNDGHYEKGNICWQTREQNNRNKRNNRRLTYRGFTFTLAEWCSRIGMNYSTLWHRVVKLKLSAEQALGEGADNWIDNLK